MWMSPLRVTELVQTVVRYGPATQRGALVDAGVKFLF
jgi:hypothetical protein